MIFHLFYGKVLFYFRAEKSEVLTEDQQGSEKRVEVVRTVSHNIIKKVTALLEAPPGTEYEKRLVGPDETLNRGP